MAPTRLTRRDPGGRFNEKFRNYYDFYNYYRYLGALMFVYMYNSSMIIASGSTPRMSDCHCTDAYIYDIHERRGHRKKIPKNLVVAASIS